MTESIEGGFELHSEARGGHWVAWISRPGEKTPYQAVVVVGETRTESEARARERAKRTPGAQAGGAASA